jgi:23S rRNA (uracil1939-C5)-methyltransferase
MEHTLKITKVIAGGKGLGTLADGMVMMVGGVLPGETVVAVETRVHRGHKEGDLARIVEASPERVVPPCPHYGTCGGCDLQHAAYPAQLAIKGQILRESLLRARLDLPEDQPGPALDSPNSLHYRHRVRLHLDQSGRLGFHQSGSNAVVPIQRCLLATEPINRTLAGLVEGGWPERLSEQIAAVELIHSPADDRVILVLQPRLPHPSEGRPAALVNQISRAGLADSVFLQTEQPGRRRADDSAASAESAVLAQDFVVRGHAYQLRWDHRCFFQVNALQNPRMIELALDLPAPRTIPGAALDLFSGMGNSSIPLGLCGAQITGVEHNRVGVGWAERNSRAAGLATARFIAAGVEQQLKALVERKARFDCILLDPPRQGLGKAAVLLTKLAPERIVSISCDPATHARDLALITGAGYRLTRVGAVDMFPQTHHIESVALLERN